MKRVATTSAYVRAWLPSAWKRALHRLLSFLLGLSMLPRRLLMLDGSATPRSSNNGDGSKRRWLRAIDDDASKSSSVGVRNDSIEDGGEFFQAAEPRSAATSRRRGLQNTGNTCFVNAVVQCLLAIPGFVDQLEDEVLRILVQDETAAAAAKNDATAEHKHQKQVQLALTLLDLLKGLAPKEPQTQELTEDNNAHETPRTTESQTCDSLDASVAPTKESASPAPSPSSKKRKRPMMTSPDDYSAAATTKRLRCFLQAASKCSELVAPKARRQDQQDAEELFLFLLDSLHELLRVPPSAPLSSDDPTTAAAAKSNQLAELSRLVEIEEEWTQRLKNCVVTEPGTYNRTVCFLSDLRWHRYLQQNTSFITEMFTGQTVRGSQCCSCANLTCLHQEFRVLSLSIDATKSTQTLDECLETHRRMEDLVADNQVFCDGHCKDKTSRRTQVLFQRAPQTLVVQLQRFKQTNWQTRAEKIATSVQFPISEPLDLTLNMFMRDSALPIQYELQAVCSHIGSALDMGHYIAYARDTSEHASSSPTTGSSGGEWFKFDDDCVTTLSEESMRDETQSSAYMLFYTQINPTLVAATASQSTHKQKTPEVGDTPAIGNEKP